MSSPIILHTDFRPDALAFAPPKKNPKGGLSVNVSRVGPDKETSKIILQTPNVTLPFEISPYKDPSGTILKYDVDISFRNAPDFLERMQGLDKALLDAGEANKQEWWPGTSKSRETIEETLRKLVKEPRMPQYSPTMRVKVPVYNNRPQALFYDENGNEVDISYVKKGCTARLILELSPVWFVSKTSYGVTWRVLQLQVLTKPGLEPCAFLSSPEER